MKKYIYFFKKTLPLIYKRLKGVFLINITKIKNPLLKSFLEIHENKKLLILFLNTKKPSYIDELEKRFYVHYKKILTLSYFSKQIHFFAQKFDKKKRLYEKKHFNSSIEQVHIDSNHLDLENLENEKISKIISKLSIENKELLILHYGYNLNLTEISKLKKTSLQSTFQRKKNILKKIKNSI